MSVWGVARFMAGLGWDAAEALAELLGCNAAAADGVYARAQADRLAQKEAAEEVAEPRCPCPGDLKLLYGTSHLAGCPLWNTEHCSSAVDLASDPTAESPLAPSTVPVPPADVEREGIPNLPFDYHPVRVIHGRGLGAAERGAEWVDKDGDLWRWDSGRTTWQNRLKRLNVCTGWYSVPTPDGTTSASYAPYTQVPSVVVERAPVGGSPAGDEVPGAAPQTPAPGTPNVNEDAGPILREAAKAIRAWTTGQPILQGELPYYRNVAHCLEIYADECEWASTKHTQ